MLLVGLTGSIATGKSLVSHYFRELGACVIDYDLISRLVVKPGMPAWQDIVNYFGHEVLQKDQTIDRAKLGSIVFKNKAKRKKLESFIHPRMNEEITQQQESAQKIDPDAIIIHDIPLLFESGIGRQLEKIIVVHAAEDDQLKRLKERDGLSEEDARSRIMTQIPVTKKLKRADYTIDNNGTKENTKKQVVELYSELSSLARKKRD